MADIAQGSANGPKKIFGRENVNWQGPQKAAGNLDSHHGHASSASSDFSFDATPAPYPEEVISDFIYSSGLKHAKESVVSAVISHHISASGDAYDDRKAHEMLDKYGDKFNAFYSTDKGKEAVVDDLSDAVEYYDIIDTKKSSTAEDTAVINEEVMKDFVEDGGFDHTIKSFNDYLQNDSSAESSNNLEDINYASLDSLEESYEELKLRDAQDRGYDSIEDYEEDLEFAQEDYIESRRGVRVVQREAVSAALDSYIAHKGQNISDEEKEDVEQQYNKMFKYFHEDGFNSETVLNTALSFNSSFEVVDVKDGELAVNEDQENQWAKSSEFDHVKEKFAEYVNDHPYEYEG